MQTLMMLIRAKQWFDEMRLELRVCAEVQISTGVESHSPDAEQCFFELQRPRDVYCEDIRECLRQIQLGESYELCLTTKVMVSRHVDPLPFYLQLRRRNPAPYAAFFRFDDFAVACSSPERFLKADASGCVESKPIKGTARRGSTHEEDQRLREDLASCRKAFSENLMIVDLIRVMI